MQENEKEEAVKEWKEGKGEEKRSEGGVAQGRRV